MQQVVSPLEHCLVRQVCLGYGDDLYRAGVTGGRSLGGVLPASVWDLLPIQEIDAGPRILQLGRSRFLYLAHRARLAFRAISRRCSGDNAAARAFPPFLAPSLDKATAWGFFAFAIARMTPYARMHKKRQIVT